ncbi:MAG: HNH endonuclease [Actinomycetota bacterium]|nr:HNH endonuclease [Actinomycetota bacterium]
MSTEVCQLIDALLRVDLPSLDQVGLQAHAVALQQAVGRLTGHLHTTLGELASRADGVVVANPGSEGAPLYRPAHQWWRDAAVLTGQQAGREVRHSTILRDLPVISAAVVAGELAPEQARVLCRLHGCIPLEDLQDSQAQLVEVARPLNTDALGKLVAHLIATHCEPALEADQKKAHERRYLQLRTDADGTVHGSFLLASEDAEVLLTVLEPLARKQELSDKRSTGQRRADALVDICSGAATWMDLPHAGGQRAQLSYVVSSDWAAGEEPPSLAEQLARDGQHPLGLSSRTASGAWTGPQTRPRIEALLCDARISRVLLDQTGQVVSLHSVKDQITSAQRRAVSARDRQCLAKGCARPPAFCDVHHLTSRADGGPTSMENLGLLCRRHHVLWHHGTIGLHDLHVPWFPEPEHTGHDPWKKQNPPLVA